MQICIWQYICQVYFLVQLCICQLLSTNFNANSNCISATQTPSIYKVQKRSAASFLSCNNSQLFRSRHAQTLSCCRLEKTLTGSSQVHLDLPILPAPWCDTIFTWTKPLGSMKSQNYSHSWNTACLGTWVPGRGPRFVNFSVWKLVHVCHPNPLL